MDKAMELNIRGIKCDSCNYKDMNVEVAEYDQWLNKPCPQCGANLLTQEDYDNVRLLINFTNTMNLIFPAPKEDEKIVKGKIEMDGTGDMKLDIED